MTDERKAGMALLVAEAALLTTMAFHPFPGEHAHLRAVATHVLAIVTAPIALYGTAILSRRLQTPLAFSYQLFALVVGVLAPIMSGFASTQGLAPEVMKLAFIINQACSRIWVGGSAVAFALWSWASWRQRFSRPLSVYGLVTAAAVLAFVFAGIPLDVHHAALLALAEAVFYVGAAVVLLRSTPVKPEQLDGQPLG